MDLFWPNATPESARRNLNWAIHSLRQTLHKNQPNFSHVLFLNECYLLNPDLQVWVDVDEFKEHIRRAQMLVGGQESTQALREYQAAEVLYQGEFLEEDRYEDWIFPISRLPEEWLDWDAGKEFELTISERELEWLQGKRDIR